MFRAVVSDSIGSNANRRRIARLVCKGFCRRGNCRPSRCRQEKGPDDELRLGWVGIGSPSSRAFQIYGTTRNLSSFDTSPFAMLMLATSIEQQPSSRKKTNSNQEQYTDYREVVDRDDIDVVVVATPDHWHAEIAIAAMLKGKDVYCEKPLTLTIEESLQLIAVQKKTGKVLQTGSQQRSEMNGVFRLPPKLFEAEPSAKSRRSNAELERIRLVAPSPKHRFPSLLIGNVGLVRRQFVPYRLKSEAIGWTLKTLHRRTATTTSDGFRLTRAAR